MVNWAWFFVCWLIVGCILAPVIGYELHLIEQEYDEQ